LQNPGMSLAVGGVPVDRRSIRQSPRNDPADCRRTDALTR